MSKPSKSDKKYYKNCFVPKCSSSSIKTPSKTLLQVPRNPKERDKWCKAAGYTRNCLPRTSWICEDHFNLRQDIVNYDYWKCLGGSKLLKKGVVPRFFECQESEQNIVESVYPLKFDSTIPNIIVCNNSNADDDEFILPDDLGSMQNEIKVDPELEFPPVDPKPLFTETCATQTSTSEKNDRGISCKPETADIGTSPTSGLHWTEEFPEIMKIVPMELEENVEEEIIEIILESSIAEGIKNGRVGSRLETITNEKKRQKFTPSEQMIYENTTELLIEENSMCLIGISKEHFSVIDDMSRATEVEKKNIYIILKKLRLNLPDEVLSVYFGVPQAAITPMILKELPKISKYLGQWIKWPTTSEMKLNLRSQCGKRFASIRSIIDVFLVKIDRFRCCVTKVEEINHVRKYFISITPDGVINYLSKGFNGFTADQKVLEDSEYVDALPEGISILADRNYKNIEALVQKKKCSIIRPPVVLTNNEYTKDERIDIQVDNAKYYVQKTVEKMRDYRFLDMHAPSKNLIDVLDHAFLVAAALVNIQIIGVS